MFYRLSRYAVVLCTAIAVLAVCKTAVAAGSVNGGSVTQVPYDAGLETFFACNAKETGDGMAKGQMQHVFKVDGRIQYITHFRVDCMLFLDESTVIVGATVVYDSDAEFIGTTAVVAIRDNGEGSDAPVDLRSNVAYSLDDPLGFGEPVSLDCELIASLIESGVLDIEQFFYPIDSGGFQVKP